MHNRSKRIGAHNRSEVQMANGKAPLAMRFIRQCLTLPRHSMNALLGHPDVRSDIRMSQGRIGSAGKESTATGSRAELPAIVHSQHVPSRLQSDLPSYRNLLLYYGGGGIESCGGFLAINEMLLQSHEGVLRFFPCWPNDQDARFGTLRTVGAFLVSAELKGGVVSGVKIVSEKGKPCTVQNPWPGQNVRVTRNGKANETLTGERVSLKTTAGEAIVIAPAER
ncbi:MAG: hypothetical protein NTW21_21330 [Verrucomicrobia bacterium]|nr:hypothetical protein [Verrucomicrobiota bacterium]